ncbi:hypothetical protein ZWY2020_054594 [Hordeum vulgare]|nr:hypothetical protein ZWY2020_054594 [Hordeum vulgare]
MPLGEPAHSQVLVILFTPICPALLSFRPLILPEYVTLRIRRRITAGATRASFDGKDRSSWPRRRVLICSISPGSVLTACSSSTHHRLLRSIHEGPH